MLRGTNGDLKKEMRPLRWRKQSGMEVKVFVVERSVVSSAYGKCNSIT